MISLSKKKEKQKQLPIEHYNFKNHLLIVAIHREEEIKVLAFRLQSCIQGSQEEPSHVCVLSPRCWGEGKVGEEERNHLKFESQTGNIKLLRVCANFSQGSVSSSEPKKQTQQKDL